MDVQDQWQSSTLFVLLVCLAVLLTISSSVTAVTNCDQRSKDSDGVERCSTTPKTSRAKPHSINNIDNWQHIFVRNGATLLEQSVLRTNTVRTKTTKSNQSTRRILSKGLDSYKSVDVSSTYPNRAHTLPPNQMVALSSIVSAAQQTDHSETTTQSAFTSFRLHAADCSEDKFVEFAGTDGEVMVLLRTNSKPFICQWQISVPERSYMIVKVESLMDKCTAFRVLTSFTVPLDADVMESLDCLSLKLKPPVFIPFSNVIYFKLEAEQPDDTNPVILSVRFRTTAEHLAKTLHVVKTSSTWGYITPPGYDGRFGYAGLMDARYTVKVPDNYKVMVSFEQFRLLPPTIYSRRNISCLDYFEILSVDKTGAERQELLVCGQDYKFPRLYHLSINVHFHTDRSGYRTGFKMRFSLYRWTDVPAHSMNMLFNCSGSNYNSFKEHLECNMEQECYALEDEGRHCPYSSPACNGLVAVSNKCYVAIFYFELDWKFAAELCKYQGSVLATVKTPEEWDAFYVFYDKKPRSPAYVGLTSHNLSMPHYYRKTSRWVDNTVNYNWHVKSLFVDLKDYPEVCGYVHFDAVTEFPFLAENCLRKRTDRFVCEIVPESTKNRSNVNSISIIALMRLNADQVATPFIRCPHGHVTYEFFSRFWRSQCGSGVSKTFSSPWSSTIMSENKKPTLTYFLDPTTTFQCASKTEYIPIAFVCDFTNDCSDGTDEDFCVHSQNCPGFTCRNGQCVKLHKVCDAYFDCVDISDETDCANVWLEFFPRQDKIPPPAIVNFDSFGFVTQIAMNESQPCPETHFRCPGKLDYCMPVYVRCNGVYDCVGREDEAGCDSGVTCPGFYHCWDSAVCVHPDHICDGWPQCPRHDDELLCNLTCPRGCHCNGLTFICRQPFPAKDFPGLRYLDASGSGMKIEDLTENSYLVMAFLTVCRLTSLSAVNLPNLKTLDLAENLLRVISMDAFLLMRNLQVLRLAGNPLVTLTSGKSSASVAEIQSIDISQTHLETFDSAALQSFATVKLLNLSFGRLMTVTEKGFRSLSQLIRLDLRGSPLKNYPDDLFDGLRGLRVIHTSNFRLCCKSYLPKHVEEVVCFSPRDAISSCEDLLRSSTYRMFLWLISVTSFIGNVGSFIFRCALQKDVSKSGFNIFVTNLCLADLLMGVHLAMVGLADILYRGQYLWYEKTWTSSEACRVAGVLSLLSSEVSAFIICLITLDRFIVLQFPFSSLRFRRKSAVIACSLVWIAGL